MNRCGGEGGSRSFAVGLTKGDGELISVAEGAGEADDVSEISRL